MTGSYYLRKRAIYLAGILMLFLCSFLFSSCLKPPWKQSRFSGSRCSQCHRSKLQSYLQKASVHKPVRDRDCHLCHEPHGYIGALLVRDDGGAVLCYRCHPKIAAQTSPQQGFVHQAIQRGGKCTACHDPHASQGSRLLKQEGQKLCFSCHDQALISQPNQHKALEKGCLVCHPPHAAAIGQQAAGLLTASREQELCLRCHSPGREKLAAAHQGYQVIDQRCSACHNPHSSNQRFLLRRTVHKPLQDQGCSACHLPADSKEPFRVKKKERIDDLCYQCHPREQYNNINIKKSVQGSPPQPHQPMREGRCLICHTPHASDRSGLLLAQQTAAGCYRCHQRIREEASQDAAHSPLKKGECTVCHDPHSGELIPSQGEWSQGGGEQQAAAGLCFKCHEKEKSMAKQPATHAPARRGECLACHVAHLSQSSDHLLREPMPRLCYRCHQEAEKTFTKVHVHTPVRDGRCLGCHEAHAGKYEHLLLFPQQELCWSCHLSLRHQLQGASALHAPLKAGDCRQCHAPHASDYKNLLSGDDGRICLTERCHQPLAKALEAEQHQAASSVHGPFKELQCLRCHSPHGSGISPQLLSQAKTLCLSCHQEHEKKLKSDTAHPPDRKGECLTCHLGHRSPYPALLAKGVDSVCLECHQQTEQSFRVAHGGLETQKGGCLTCHDPHSSQGKGLFRKVIHEPFKTKKCHVCHQSAK